MVPTFTYVLTFLRTQGEDSTMARHGERVTCEAIDEHFTPVLLGQIVQTKLGDGVVRFVGFLQHTAEPR